MKLTLHVPIVLAVALSSLGSIQATTLNDVMGQTRIHGYYANNQNDESSRSWVELNADGSMETLWIDNEYQESGFELIGGWVLNGNLNASSKQFMSYGGRPLLTAGAYEQFDLATGEVKVLTEYGIQSQWQSIFASLAYCPKDGKVYGFMANRDNGSFEEWRCANADSQLEESECIRELGGDSFLWCPSLCYNEDTDAFYGISFSNQFLKIGYDGSIEELFDLPTDMATTGDNTGLVYVAETKKFLWSRNAANASGLYVIDIEGAKPTIEKVLDLPSTDCFNYFYAGEMPSPDSIPEAPTPGEATFPDGNLEGAISFSLPADFLDGSQIGDKPVSWTVADLSGILASGVGSAGENVEVKIAVAESGSYEFTISSSVEGVSGPSASIEIYIGKDTPSAPVDAILRLDDDTLSAFWQAVTTGSHDGYVDPSMIRYKVYLNDEYVGETAETEFDFSIEVSSAMISYVAKIVAVFEDMESVPAYTNSITVGSALSLPVEILPTEEQAAAMTYFNLVEGQANWKYNTTFTPPVFSSGYNKSGAGTCDNWLITPAIELSSADAVYKLSFESRTFMWSTNEALEVYGGYEPTEEGMSINLIDTFMPCSDDISGDYDIFETYEHEFTVETPGKFYIGFRCVSPENEMGVLLRNICLSSTSSVNHISSENVVVSSGEGFISVAGGDGNHVEIYSASGQLIKSAKVGCSHIPVGKGIYIVKCGAQSAKVVVK